MLMRVATPSMSLSAMLREACLAELRALKPGNVSAHRLSYTPIDAELSVKDFELSAEAIAESTVTTVGQSVGARVLSAVKATRAVINTNTNLGIVLLCLPAIYAGESIVSNESIEEALHRVLTELTVDDAKQVFEAIRIAQPGGMGRVQSQDISQAPSVSLRQAMAMAADRDAIARAYVNDYAVIFDVGLPALQEAGDSPLATTYLYLSLLAAQKDSLMVRKWGDFHASEVMIRAREWRVRCKHALHDLPEAIETFEEELALWDKALKLKAHNPGTTADFTVASLLIQAMQRERKKASAADGGAQ